jgi:hypothetical protein
MPGTSHGYATNTATDFSWESFCTPDRTCTNSQTESQQPRSRHAGAKWQSQPRFDAWELRPGMRYSPPGNAVVIGQMLNTWFQRVAKTALWVSAVTPKLRSWGV